MKDMEIPINSDKSALTSINSKSLFDKLNEFAKTESVKQWDLGASTSKDQSVQVEQGEAKQLKGSQRTNLTIRVWNKQGLVGTTSTSDFSDLGLEKAFNGAYQASNYGNPNDIPQFSILAKAELPIIKKPIVDFVGIKSLLDTLRDAEANLLNKYTAIKTVPYNGLAESIFQRIYLNSEGAHRTIHSTQASLYLYARAEEEGFKPRSSGSLRVGYGIKELDIDSCINEAASKTISHLNYEPIDTGKYLVCFKPEAFLELIGSFSNMFNARAVLDGVSLSQKETLGEQICSPILSLYDNAIHPSNITSCGFDGEGTPTRNLCLIKNGVLENFIHSEATARKFGVKPTGHAGMGSKVSVGADWLVVEKSQSRQANRIELDHNSFLDKFVLIENLNALHSGVKASQGSFSLPFDGWLVNKGQKISIEAATVAGDINKVLNNIIHIEDDQRITNQGLSPHVWVHELSVTGEQ